MRQNIKSERIFPYLIYRIVSFAGFCLWISFILRCCHYFVFNKILFLDITAVGRHVKANLERFCGDESHSGNFEC